MYVLTWFVINVLTSVNNSSHSPQTTPTKKHNTCTCNVTHNTCTCNVTHNTCTLGNYEICLQSKNHIHV